MNNQCFFSIIIPCYNSQEHLEKCLNSIASQTFSDFEIVMINDGSTDHTEKMIREFQKTESRIKLLNQKNQGVAAARNHGILHAAGKYIIFLDSDDMLVENSLENAYDALKDGRLDMAVCDSYIELYQGNAVVNHLFSHKIFEEERSLKQTKILCQNLSSMCIAIYSRAFLLEQALLVKEGITCAEDTDFFFRALCFSRSMDIIPCTLFAYVYNDSSVSNNLSYKNIRDVMMICSNRIQELIKHPGDEIDIDKALNFFATKYIHFAVKIGDLSGPEKKELLEMCCRDKRMLKYVQAKQDRAFVWICTIFGVRSAVTVFNGLVKLRNRLLKSN